MFSKGRIFLTCLAVSVAAPCLAKNDIRGVTTAQPLADALDYLELDGARCGQPNRDHSTTCIYDEHSRMTLYYAAAPPWPIEKIVYTFIFTDMNAIKDRLQQLYGLKKTHIEGEHRLLTGQRLLIELKDRHGSVSIVDDEQIRKDEAARH